MAYIILSKAILAAVTGMKARYIRDRGFDKKYYQDMILALIREHESVKRQDIDELLLSKEMINSELKGIKKQADYK